MSIYLAGPIEHDDAPRSWRDDVQERHPDVEFIDPMDWQDEWEFAPAVVWDRELRTVRTNDVLVCNVGSDAPRTTGTHHEIREALNAGRNVAIVPSGDLSQIYDLEDVMVYDSADEAVHSLVALREVVGGD